MLKKISIREYKSIKTLNDFELKPLNVLIGPNRSGKSNFLDLLELIGEAGDLELSKGIVKRGGLKSLLWAGGKGQGGINIELKYVRKYLKDFDKHVKPPKVKYSFGIYSTEPGFFLVETINDVVLRDITGINQRELHRYFGPDYDVEDISSNELMPAQNFTGSMKRSAMIIRISIKNTIGYKWFNTSQDSGMRRSTIIESSGTKSDTRLDKNGDNLTNVYYHIINNHEYVEFKNEIMSILESVFKGFKEITFPPEHGKGAVQFGWHENFLKRPLYQSELSDGTLRFLCLLALFQNPNPPTLVCIDEPCVGLHPQMLDVLAEIIKEASDRMQIVITTHSPRFLRNFKPEDIVVVENENGESKFERQDPDRLEEWLKSFNLDELWQMGELGGKI